MPQDGRYRRRSRSRSRSKRNRRRRHGSSKSSGSSYSRSRSRTPEKRYREKERSSRRTPPKYRRSSKRSPSHERKRRYDHRSRSASSSPRRRDKKGDYNLESSKVLTGNFSDIPGLDYIGRGSKGRAKNDSSQDLDLRLRELETQQGSAGSSRSRAAEQSKNSQRGYYDSKSGSQESYKQRSRSPEEKKYNSSRYSKERSRSPDDDRYRDQKDKKRPDYGLRVEVKRKPSPKRSKFDPSLVVVPRRKDEGLQALFDRPEIVVRNLDDDPEMYPEKYERFACWRKSPERDERKNHREYSREREERQREERPRKQNRHHKEVRRSPSPEPQQPRETTVMMKPFTVYEKYEQSLRNKPVAPPQELDNYLSRSQDYSSLSQSTLPLSGSTSMFSSGLGIDSVLDLGSDLRLDLDVRRQFLVREAEKQLDLQQLQSTTSPTVGRLSGSAFSLDRREIASSDRRPVRERLGELDAVGMKMDSGVPDFRKEVEELQRLDPTAQPFRGKYFQHDDRDERALSEEKRDVRPPLRGRGGRGTFVPRGSYRGGRGFPRGSYRGSRGFTRGFRGSYNRGLSTWTSSRGGYGSSWKHDKFEGKDRDEKRDKKEKKSKSSSDKKKTKKSSKRTPERSKSKRDSKK